MYMGVYVWGIHNNFLMFRFYIPKQLINTQTHISSPGDHLQEEDKIIYQGDYSMVMCGINISAQNSLLRKVSIFNIDYWTIKTSKVSQIEQNF